MRWLGIVFLLLLDGVLPTSSSLFVSALGSANDDEKSIGFQDFSANSTTMENQREVLSTYSSRLPISAIDNANDSVWPSTHHSVSSSNEVADTEIQLTSPSSVASYQVGANTDDSSQLESVGELSTASPETTTFNDKNLVVTTVNYDEEFEKVTEKQVVGSSPSLRVESTPVFSLTPVANNKVEPSALADTAISPNSTDLDKLSAADLNTELEVAKTELEKAKIKTANATRNLTEMNQSAIETNEDYEKKKAEWERLDKIAKEMAENWTIDEDTAHHAAINLTTVMTRIKTANQSLIREKEALEKFPEKIEKAKAKLAEIEGRPARLIELNTQKTAMETGKPNLLPTVTQKSGVERSKFRAWDTANKTLKGYEDEYVRAKCADPVRKESTCSSTIYNIGESKKNIKTAEEEYNTAKSELDEAQRKLDNYDVDLLNIDDEIKALQSSEPNYQRDWKIANDTIATLEKDEGLKRKRVEYWQGMMEQAVEDETPIRSANDAAHEKVKNGRPREIDTAADAATTASIAFGNAEHAKTTIDEKVGNCTIALKNAEAEEKIAELYVKDLTDKYEAKRKEEALSTGSTNTTVIIVVVFVVFILVAAAAIGFFVYLRRKKNKATGKKKAASRTPTSRRTTTPDNAHLSLTQHEGGLDQEIVPTGGAPSIASVRPNGDPSGHAQQPQIKEEIKDENKTPEGLPDPATTPFIPGEEPFKIPAKNFKWKGPMRRRSRWHGPPDHEFEGKNKGVETVDKIWFDPNANYATEIGPNEIIEDGGPASDSNRSEWLNNLDEWERGNKALMEADKAKKEGKPGEKGVNKDKPEPNNEKKEESGGQDTKIREEDATVPDKSDKKPGAGSIPSQKGSNKSKSSSNVATAPKGAAKSNKKSKRKSFRDANQKGHGQEETPLMKTKNSSENTKGSDNRK